MRGQRRAILPMGRAPRGLVGRRIIASGRREQWPGQIEMRPRSLPPVALALSLHPFYRRRLARTFAVRRTPDKGQPNTAERYPDNEPAWLHQYGWATDGPKFVFACSATVTGPDKPAPGLNAVSYVMSADYVGGPELGGSTPKNCSTQRHPGSAGT